MAKSAPPYHFLGPSYPFRKGESPFYTATVEVDEKIAELHAEVARLQEEVPNQGWASGSNCLLGLQVSLQLTS